MLFPSLDGSDRLHDAHDAGTGNAEGARQCADRFAGLVLLGHGRALLVGRTDRTAQGLALRLRTRQAGLGAFYQQVALHLGDGSQHVQHELAGGTGQVELAQLQDDDLDAVRGQCLDRGPDVLGIAAEAIELRYHQRLAAADLAEHLGELWALGRRDLARHALIRVPVVGRIAGHLDLAALVLRRLFFCADPAVSENCHF
jgi:hypothetical protein